ncbi:unnamed protein product [Tenebrio molitor]|nr:unnamed protein product [Tenebrio molitor]
MGVSLCAIKLKPLNKIIYSMEDVVNIFTILMENLLKNSRFKPSTHFKKFGELKTNLDRMNFVFRDMEKCKTHPPFKKDKKDDTVAIKNRERGNIFFKSANYREALDCYTISILTAESNEILALAYANRSAALSKLDLLKECLTDIDRAFQHGYPDNLKQKLIARQKYCTTQKVVERIYYESTPKFPESEKNSEIKNARNCVKILKNEKYGRYVVATRNIDIGEVLVVEPPYAAIQEHEIYVHCHECFTLCYNLIPCGECTKALYCSENCKDKALNTYHKYECSILLSLDLIQLDFPKRLALKMVFIGRNEWNKYNTVADETDKMYCSDRFKEMRDLETHTDKRNSQNLYSRTAIACGLFHLIKNHTTLLQEDIDEDRLKDVILLMILVCGINTVGINELSPDMMGIYNLNPTATAIYSFFTLFSHSCWPNISRHFHGSSLVLRANNTIKKGEQCFVVYGPSYLSYTKEFRQDFLKEHQFFTCTCRACEENWPVRNLLSTPKDWRRVQFFTMMKLAAADVDAAKREVRQLFVNAKKAEKNLPPGQDYIVKDLLSFCYNIFGNKRRV